MGYHSHYLSKPPAAARNFRGPKKKSHYSSEVYCYFCMPTSRLINFFLKVTFYFLKKRTTRYTHKKRTKQDTLPFFLNLLLLVFFIYVCMYFFFLVCILLFSVVTLVALFFHFSSLTILCIEYQVLHTWNSWANLCREEENLVFCFGAQFNSTLNFTQSGWHILFSPDFHFRLAKRVSGQTLSLQLETVTRTVVPLVVPA